MIEPIYFMRGRQRFEVRHEPTESDFPYAGYVDGVRSVTASRADIAVRALLRKHGVTRQTSAAVVDFATVRGGKVRK